MNASSPKAYTISDVDSMPADTTTLTLQRHLLHSLATSVLKAVVTYPSWLTSEALRASPALRPPPPRRVAAPSGAPRETRVPDACGGEPCSAPSWQRNGQCLAPSRARS